MRTDETSGIGRPVRVRIEDILPYIFIGILGLVVFTWFDGRLMYFSGDTIPPLNPVANIKLPLYTWNNNHFGYPATDQTRLIFPYGFYFFFTILGLPLHVTQRLFFFLNYTLPGISMYYLASTLYPESRYKKLACLIAALFYMYPQFNQTYPIPYFPWGVFPLCLAAFIRGLNAARTKEMLLHATVFAFAFIGILNVLLNYSLLVMLIISLIMIMGVYIGFDRLRAVHALKCLLTFGVISLLINLYVIVPFLNFYQALGYSALEGVPIWYPESSIFQVFTLTPNLSDSATYWNAGLIVKMSTVITTAIALIAVPFLLRQRQKFIVSFFLIFIVTALISFGVTSPLGGIYRWLLENIPYFRTFRTVGELTVVLGVSIAVLLGFAFSNMMERIGSRAAFRRLFILGCLLLIMINGWPLTSGANFKSPPAAFGHYGHEIPQAYYDANEWLSKNNAGNAYVLWVPLEEMYSSLDWQGEVYFGGLPTFVFDIPLIFSETYPDPVQTVYNALASGDFAQTAGEHSVRFIILDRSSRKLTPLTIQDLTDSPAVKRVATFGHIEIFEIEPNKVRPKAHTIGRAPVEFSEINPTLYNVRVDAATPFWLVLNTAYNEGWGAYLEDGAWQQLSIFLGQSGVKEHINYHGFNAWYIEQTGDVSVTLQYYPQLTYYASIMVSGVTIMIIVVYLLSSRVDLLTLRKREK